MRIGLLMLLIVAFLAGCQTRTATAPKPAVARFLLESEANRAAEVTLPVSGVRLRVLPKPVILEYDILKVELAQLALGRCLLFQLTPAAARDLHRMTAVNHGRRLALLINDQPLGARVIDAPMQDGTILVFCEVPDEELSALFERLKRTTAELRNRQVSSLQKAGVCFQPIRRGVARGRPRAHASCAPTSRSFACKQAPTSRSSPCTHS